ncbi:MFS transporter [Alkalihalobacillus sp. TS-13]|uniref:MFS transporter n=1 Tax=Alkalihalobacillus sp. TS-13 TaxID=2842455 RepID=UPI001C87BD65|nr:MFS transporter [Alkalihalobacillus sp. TS-13]
MRQINNKTLVKLVGLITAVCGLGDAMLFIVLPIYYPDFGLTFLWQVGVLLSINRFIRLPINPLVGWFYLRMSKRAGLLLAVLLAIGTTFSYGWLQNFWLLFIARCVWGVAWSFLRLGGYLTVLEASSNHNRGHFIGIYNGLAGLGGLVGMLAGGLMTDLINIKIVTNTFSMITLLVIPFVIKYIPSSVPTSKMEKGWITQKRGYSSIWKTKDFLIVLGSGLLIPLVVHGVFASTLSTMISKQLSSIPEVAGVGIGAASLAGIIQAIR